MIDHAAGFRLDVRRLDTRWAFHILDPNDRIWSGAPKETYATRREATQAGEAVMERLRSRPAEQLQAQLDLIERQARDN